MTGALDGLVVLDLSRILAGPTCTQLLGDMGAEVIKVENPSTRGDETRSWGPPFVQAEDGSQTDLSSYFICANRNKKSVAVDIKTAEGQRIVKELAQRCDVVVENFKPGGLEKYGLDYASLCRLNPRLIYASISGFGQTGPNRHKPGYDIMAQGFGGFMSLTGEPDGPPMKAPIGIADVMCGMYTCIGVLAALHHRDKTGEGQQLDVALMDSQIAGMINEGTNYLTTKVLPKRQGTAHPNIAPYQVFPTQDGHVILAVGNDAQFVRFCEFVGMDHLPSDPRFSSNPARLTHKQLLAGMVEVALRQRTTARIIEGLEALQVPVGPVQNLEQVFASDQVAARQMKVHMADDARGVEFDVIGNPINFSVTPVAYRDAPPQFGQDTQEVLRRFGVKGDV